MSQTSYDHHPTLRHEERAGLGTLLQGVLVDVIELGRGAKQLHWNVTGPGFRPLHEQLDELAGLADGIADDTAERARALGWSPDGRTASVAASTTLPPLGDGTVAAEAAVAQAVALLVAAIASVRVAMDRAGEYDAVTEDLLHQAVLELEKQAWMFSAWQGH
jgi:starvation-inducible DNA-binding protein